MQIGTAHHLELPTQLREKLEAYRRQVWIVKLAEGILAGCFGLLLSYLLIFTLDRFWDTPNILRLLILVAGTAGLALWLPWKWHRWVWQTRRLEQAARLLRHHSPHIGDQLLGIVELADNDLEQERSEALCRAAMQQVDQEVRDCDFSGGVPSPRHRHWAWATGVVLLLSTLILVAIPAAGTNALVRWLFPWRDTDRYTFVQFSDLPDRIVVPYAERFAVSTQLAKSTVWSPEHGRAKYGEQTPITTARHDDQYRFEVPPQNEPAALQISIGDAKEKIDVVPTPRPELLAITARVLLPEYLGRRSHLEHDVRSGSLSVVKDSRVAITASVTRVLNAANLDDTPLRLAGNHFKTSTERITSLTEWEFRWQDAMGLSAKEPFRLTIDALDDEPPYVTASQMPREQVILNTEPIKLEAIAQDDFGIRLVGVQWQGIADRLRNPQPDTGERILALGGTAQTGVQLSTILSAAQLEIHPQSLEIQFFAEDYFPNRQRSYSSTYIVHVLSPEEHAIWLTQQFRQWYQRAEEVYERELQLFEENKALRSLPANDLDAPATRRRIENQASAEQNNAQRLSVLTQSGSQLVEEAARNEQFNVASLETWAQMLQTLEDIASNRMPSVTDLLADAATAPGLGASADVGETESSSTPPQVGFNRNPVAGKGQAGESPPGPAVPKIVDVESGFNEADSSNGDTSQASQSPPKFGLPSTDIVGGGEQKEETKSTAAPVQQHMAAAVKQQEALLAEFAKVAEELKKLLGDLEGSTFVKRLKAASRRQLEVATELNQAVATDFGMSQFRMDAQQKSELSSLAEREVGYGDQVYVIQDDLEAYYNRVQQGKYHTVLNEMKSSNVVTSMHDIAKSVGANFSGDALAQAEFWADTLDRWAEQLVGPG